ncbi:MAG: AsnC family protein [Candidatus Bathyarchaeota archaeon]|nr:MAG: AsnC family protein [Candidatus Bathyarchaeota archaeon]
MKEGLDFLDLRILEAIGERSPRNLASVARKLGIEESKLYSRLRRLKSFIFLNINVYHTFIGLRKVVVIARASQGQEMQLFECMKANDYWLYVFRCYGEYEGCSAVYAIPPKHENEFISFVEALRLNGIAQSVELFWSTCFHTVNPTTNWYDVKSDKWMFLWDQWIKEIEFERTDLPYSLIDPVEFPQKADYTDIFILKELEIDATRTLSAIAERLGISLQLAKYHFDKHVVKRKLLESYQVISFPFDKERSDFFVFILMFPTQQNLAKFSNFLFDKIFVRTIGKIHGENGLIIQIHLPRKEFRCFIDTLSTLVREGFLSSYRYLIQDLQCTSRQTIPYQLFAEGTWQYDHEKFMEKLDFFPPEKKEKALE